MSHQFYVICGLHRSGTTYLGEVLHHIDSTVILHEPFNKLYGLKNVSVWFPYVKDSTQACAGVIRKAAQVSGTWCKPIANVHGKKNSIRFKLIGGKKHMQWRLLKLRNILHVLPSYLIWKDPFCTFMVEYLTVKLDVPVACMIKHPCSHFYSVSKQQWEFDISNLREQKELIHTFAHDISDELWQEAETDNIVSIALLWKIMARVVKSSDAHERLLVIRHEDLCVDPQAWVKKVCVHFNMPFTDKAKTYILNTTQGGHVEAADGKIHDFKRDSKSLASVWQDKLSIDTQHKILKVVGDDLYLFYPENI